MLKRLYVHNYKCLVNFEINFDQDISLFLGANGSGKSTVFEVLAKLRRVIVDEEKLANIFDFEDTPRWVTPDPIEKSKVRFELDLEIKGVLYKYLLVIEFVNRTKELSIEEESFGFDDELFILSKNGKTTLVAKNNEELPFDNSRSCMRFFQYKSFINALNTFFIVRIKPYEMTSTINKADSKIRTDFSNFAEWFAHLNENNRRDVSIFEDEMRDILPGFDYFKIEQAGQAKVLQVEFENKSNKKDIITYYFNELSEGQKVLISLYALIYCAPEYSLICIDEPENFLALPEIQPWLNVLRERCKRRFLQALIISHHPSLINFLAPDSGYWFSRQENHTTFEKITEQEEDGLSLAQLIEMGWIYGD